MAPSPRPVCWVDLETTGTRAGHHEIVQIAAIQTSPDLRDELRYYHARVIPAHPERMSPGAARVNGYDEKLWLATAIDLDSALAALSPLLDGAQIGGHNVAFDRAFLTAAYRAWPERRRPRWAYSLLDTASLGYRHVVSGRVARPGLELLCGAEGVSLTRDDAHDARQDIRATLELARRLLGVEVAKREAA